MKQILLDKNWREQLKNHGVSDETIKTLEVKLSKGVYVEVP
jgi:hypothetical protein